jgi:formylglycine-generating enzyme required for sulfatase activity
MPSQAAAGVFPKPAALHEPEDPDLILGVTQETIPDGRRVLRFVVNARETRFNLRLARFESKPFNGEPHEYFRECFREVARIPSGYLADWLAGRGVQLFAEIFPEPLQSRLCSLVGSVRTVQILSNEAWIPWELLKLQDPRDPSASRPFLVEAFILTRWLTDLRLPQVRHLPMRRIALVVPQDSGLRNTRVEAERMKSFGGTEREVVEITASLRQVQVALASGRYDGWHFAGHGLAGRGGSIFLEQGEELSPAILYGPARQLEGCRPLVFLNACHSGQGEPSLTKIDGLAAAFLETGAGAFIGSHWEVNDEQACCFAEQLYQHLFSGLEIGEAVRKARLGLRAKFPDGNAWLAYTVFADPAAYCVPAPVAHQPRAARKRRIGKTLVEVVSAVPQPTTGQAREASPLGLIELPSPESKKLEGPRPGEERINEKDGTVLVYVPGGEFTIGAEGADRRSEPLRRVRLSPFWIAKFPVTNSQYSLYLKENPACRKPAFWEDPKFNPPQHPVVGLSWDEAQAYCQWAGLEFPSEAQWEAAARGSDQRPYPWGKESPTLLHANFNALQGGTTPVGAYPAGAGPYGTLDQAGNVWEWCADPWSFQAYRQIENGQWDPIAQGDKGLRALRGGSWKNPAQDLRAAYRDRGMATLRVNHQGFRGVQRPA